MTSLGPSPPRSKKESSAASEPPVRRSVELTELPRETISAPVPATPVPVTPAPSTPVAEVKPVVDAVAGVKATADEPESDQSSDVSVADDATADTGRGAARLARRDAKALARQKREEAREKLAASKAQARTDALAAKAAARVDSSTAEQVSPEVLELAHDEPAKPAVAQAPVAEKPAVGEPSAPTPKASASSRPSRVDPVALAAAASSDEVEIADDIEFVDDALADPRPSGRGASKNAPLDFAKYELERVESGEAARDAQQKAQEKQDRERAEADEAEQVKVAAKAARRDAKEAANRERAEAKAASQQAKIAARESKKTDQAGKKDRIVEPPREPKVPIADKVRAARPKRPAETATGGSARNRRVISVLAGVIGAVGLICSVVLAFGALLVALDADGGSVYDLVSGVCDVLVGPLRDMFSFSGSNAAMKESLVAWGAGSIIYLVVGVVAQSMLRSALDD